MAVKKSFIAFCLSITLGLGLKAQLRIDTTKTAQELVQQVLMSDKSDLLIKNITFKGSVFSMGSFENESPEVIMDKGIILSTGDVFDALGPNKKPNTGVRASGLRDNDLQSIATGVVIDATILEFDLLALRDSLVFEYVFASEEYPEYVAQGVNDVFGFFVQEHKSRALNPQNIALLPDGRTIVSIDNVNHRQNEVYFLRSDYYEGKSTQFWEQNRAMMMRSRIFEFDGFTVPLKAKAMLKAGSWYHFKIAISDVGDRFFDSAVMIKAKSFSAKGEKIPQANEIVKSFIRSELKSEEVEVDEKNGRISFDLQIQFNTNESIILPESYEILAELIDLMHRFSSLNVLMIGHTDSEGSESANLELSENRANAVRDYLIQKGISAERLSTAFKGESEPQATNSSESGKYTNRRVEFVVRF
ncbi:MAG: OmpA family protein [Vicingaceae bacterium]